MKLRAETAVALLLVAGSITMAIVFASVAAERPLTSLEAVLFQAFSLPAGLLGSFLFGRQSAESAARQILKPHARSAFRRVLSLYQSISRLAREIESARAGPSDSIAPSSGRDGTIEVFRAIVTEQLSTADDALEDWNDLVPEDVAEIRDRAKAGSNPFLESSDE